MQPVFYYNNKFHCLSGHRYWVGGELCFPDATIPIKDTTYRTIFGPSVHHGGLIYGNNNMNVKFGMRRMTAMRPPPNYWFPDLEERERYTSYNVALTQNQSSFIERHHHYFEMLKTLYTPFFVDYQGAEVECIEHHNDPHNKRVLRVNGFDELISDMTLSTRKWVSEVVYKMKKNEWAKFGKYPRMIGDLGVCASLHGFRVTEFLKDAEYQTPLFINGIDMQFVKSPSQKILREVFIKLMAPDNRGYFAYFSDDSCFSIRVNGTVYVYNLDISSCDASHTKALFDALLAITPDCAVADMENLIEQLKCPIRIRSCDDKKKSVLLSTEDPILLSGSTVTTLINNVANRLIALALSEADFFGCRTSEEIEAIIMQAAFEVGYIVTCQRCVTYSDIQFLKHSPVYDTMGRLQPLLNLGVLLRLSGVCDRDLPGHGCIKERARIFQSELLRGVYPNVGFELIDRMRMSVLGKEPSPSHLKWVQHTLRPSLEYKVCAQSDDETFRVDMEEIYARYPDITNACGAELIEDLGSATYGTVVACEAASHILKKDYGLTCD